MPESTGDRAGRRRRILVTLLAGVALLALAGTIAVLVRAWTPKPVSQGGTVQPPPNATGIEGPAAKSLGVFAAPGDGTVRFAAAASFGPDGFAVLQLRVTNAGTVRAVYTVEIGATATTPVH